LISWNDLNKVIRFHMRGVMATKVETKAKGI